jgi:hypothetical protein
MPFGFLAALLILCFAGAARAELGVNLFGASYHFEREKAEELGLTNEVNPGLGVRFRKPWRERLDLFTDAGFYRDSARNTAVFIGSGGLWHATEGARLGLALVLLKSDTYNNGDAFIAPAPLVAYEWDRVGVSMVYFPKFGDVNPTNQVGFWLTLRFPD